jgi:hypothetical protein
MGQKDGKPAVGNGSEGSTWSHTLIIPGATAFTLMPSLACSTDRACDGHILNQQKGQWLGIFRIRGIGLTFERPRRAVLLME